MKKLRKPIISLSKEELIEMIFHYEERLKEEIKYWNKVKQRRE